MYTGIGLDKRSMRQSRHRHTESIMRWTAAVVRCVLPCQLLGEQIHSRVDHFHDTQDSSSKHSLYFGFLVRRDAFGDNDGSDHEEQRCWNVKGKSEAPTVPVRTLPIGSLSYRVERHTHSSNGK